MNPALLALLGARVAAGGGGAVTATWIGAVSTAADSDSYSLSMPSGTSGVGTLVGIAARKATPSGTVTGVTIGGTPATILAEAIENGSTATFAYAPVDPSSGPAVVVAWSRRVLRGAIGAWATDGTPTVLDTSTTSGGGTVDTRAGSSVVAVSASVSDTAPTIGGLTVRSDAAIGGESSRAAFADAVGSGSPLTVTSSPPSAVSIIALS